MTFWHMDVSIVIKLNSILPKLSPKGYQAGRFKVINVIFCIIPKIIIFAKIFSLKTFIACNCTTP